MQRLTNGRFRSTPHRVITPPPPLPMGWGRDLEPTATATSVTTEEVDGRLALIFFFAAPYDADIRPILLAEEQDVAPQFEAVRAGALSHAYLTAGAKARTAFDKWAARASDTNEARSIA